MERFRNKYRIPSARLQNWDYGWNAAYFVTICIQHRECYFGNILSGTIDLFPPGLIAEQIWLQIPDHFNKAILDAFIIMPNHIHGIIIINNQSRCGDAVDCRDAIERSRDAINRVSTTTTTTITTNQSFPVFKNPGGITGNHNPMFHINLSRIIRWYKGRTTFEIRKTTSEFQWQQRFHEHIIRNHDSFVKIQDYIKNNPAKWNDDEFYGIS